jgi:subtilisin-like proprotein convertase family protein
MNQLLASKIFRQSLAISIVLFLVLTQLPTMRQNSVQAFMPTNARAFLLTLHTSNWTHQSMTRSAIKELDAEFFSITKLTNSMKKAIEQIADSDAAVDALPQEGGTQFDKSASHFDGENFQGSQERLTNYMLTVITALHEQDAKKARYALGQALHTLQDFYSHSNWIELGNRAPYAALGVPGVALYQPPQFTRTCTDCVRNDCPDCPNNLTTVELTTGYYGGDDRAKPHEFKCSHGGRFDSSAKGAYGNGINKDTVTCPLSPHNDLHATAASVAKEATKGYIREIKNRITFKQLKLLLGVGGTLAFAIDTTGSMTDEIAGVKLQAMQIVDSRLGTELEPANYVLMPFNDPGVGPMTVTDDPETFKNAISALTANEGGDCPELPNTALVQAIPAMDGGDIMVFTDAAPKDSVPQGNFARGLADENDVTITYMLSGSCSPLDPSYFRMARETGGQVFGIAPGEADDGTKLADLLTRPDKTSMLWVEDILSGTAKTYAVPIDSATTRATFAVNGTSDVTVKRPNGTTVLSTDADVSTIALGSGAILSILNPVPGAWSVIVNGSGEFSIKVSGESKLDFTTFQFVKTGGDPAHEGDFPIDGSPRIGQTSKVDALISADEVTSAQFELRTPAGTVLQTLTLEEIPTLEGLYKEFYGDVTVPSSSFLVYAKGVDAAGNDYQRVFPGAFNPQSVEIILPTPPDLHNGEITTYTIQVKNHGATDTFELSGKDSFGYPGSDSLFMDSISPSSFTLAANETINVAVELLPPLDTPQGHVEPLSFTVRSTGTSGAVNYANVDVTTTLGKNLELGFVTPRVAVGDSDLLIEPNEIAALSVQLLNRGAAPLSDVVATLTTETPGVTITNGTSAYFDLPFASATSLPTGNGVNRTPYTFVITDPAVQSIKFALAATYSGSLAPQMFYFTVPTILPGPPLSFGYTGPTVAIPDGNVDTDGPPVNIPITVTGVTSTIADINFRIDGNLCTATAGATTVGIEHSYVADLVVKLTSPQGTTVTLIDGAGGGLNDGNNFCQTVFDDEGGLSLIDLILPAGPPPLGPPYSGTFIPESPLAAFKGQNANGVWTITVIDRFAGDTGNVRAFSLVITSY